MAGTGPLIDVDIPVCGSSKAANIVREYMRSSCRLVLESVGEETVAAVAASGSATLGELTALMIDEGDPLILSDVDLSVVTKTDSHRDRVKSFRPGLLEVLGALREASSMCSPPEIGVYSLRDLEIQAPKMGVLEMRESGKVLWGDGEALKRLPEFGPQEITKHEAIALLFNRCFEQLSAADRAGSNEPREAAGLLYAGAKSFLDAGTSLVAYHGLYALGYGERLARVKIALTRHHAAGLGTLSSEAFLRGLSFWTAFKIEPDLAKVAGRFGTDLGAGGLRQVALSAWVESWLPLAEVWMALAAAEGIKATGGVLGACRALIGTQPALDRVRGWKRLVHAGEVPAARAIRLSRAGSPIHLLRLSAFCVLQQLGEGGANEIGSDRPLDDDASSFLETYFPAPVRAEDKDAGADAWRRRVVDVWRRWTERYWS